MEIVIPYKPKPLQSEMHRNAKRWNLFVCHRRFGKTVWAINHLIMRCLTNSLEAPRYAYVAPFLKQSKAIAWDFLKKYSRPIPGISINETELRVGYPNGGGIRLFGADNPDAARGVYLDGAILDEYAQMSPAMFSEVVRPALSDRQGWCVWLGTPKGRNHFYDLYEMARTHPEWCVRLYKANETGILPQDELASARSMMGDDAYQQEYECSWQAALRGAFFASEVAKAREDGRITRVPAEKNVLVDTWWDLGMDDSTAIWFTQDVGREVHVIDYLEATGEGLGFYKDQLDKKGYRYGRHCGPHDLAVRELGPGKSRVETARELGINFQVVPRVERKEDAIQASRNIFGICWFDETRCARGITALESYRREWDDRLQVFRSVPLHDEWSHGADAFQTFARGHQFARSSGRTAAATPRAVGWT